MIRASALQIADAGCGHAAELAKQYPEGSTAAERGHDIHFESDAWWKFRKVATSVEAKAIIQAIQQAAAGATVESEITVQLLDPEDGALITEGTADVLWVTDENP